jgi:hypothetical protein
MKRLVGLGLLVGGFGACDEPVNACDDYVAYMCDCHPEVDCGEITATYADAEPSVQDQCVVALEDQQDDDDTAGLVCPPA